MSSVTMKALLEAGVHFGHQTRRWNPRMKPYIFGARNGIHIIDLQQTMQLFKEATDFIIELSRQNKRVLFVGTKRQAQDAVREEALRCGMHYVNNRWLGGLLTNWQTVQQSIKKFKTLQQMKEVNYAGQISKKAITRLERRRRKLERNMTGIQEMDRLPDVLVVVDPRKEQIAIQEANKMNIPVVALVDTNCDPSQVQYVIPGNDDALRSVRLVVSKLAESVMEGQEMFKAERAAAEADGAPVEEPEKPVTREHHHGSGAFSSERDLRPARSAPSGRPRTPRRPQVTILQPEEPAPPTGGGDASPDPE